MYNHTYRLSRSIPSFLSILPSFSDGLSTQCWAFSDFFLGRIVPFVLFLLPFAVKLEQYAYLKNAVKF